jgi:hypothetical protein
MAYRRWFLRGGQVPTTASAAAVLRVAVLLAAVLIAVGTGLASASDTSVPGWRATSEVGSATTVTYNDSLLAVGTDDAWADWSGCGPDCQGGSTFTVSHWNGRSWRNLPWPASLHPYQDAIREVSAIGATSAGDLWLFKDNGKTAGVLRWNGKSWSVSQIPSWALRVNGSGGFNVVPVISGPRSGWVFSLDYLFGPTPDIAAREVNGRWEKVDLGGVPVGASADGASDIWLMLGKGDTPPVTPKYTLLHWDGHRWHSLAAPEVAVPRNATDYLSMVAVSGPRSVWISATIVGRDGSNLVRLLHWNGEVWSRVTTLPDGVYSPAPDGQGGFWAAGIPAHSNAWYFYHYSDGRWSSRRVPGDGTAPAGQVHALALVPGSTSMLAAGDVNFPPDGVVGTTWQCGR